MHIKKTPRSVDRPLGGDASRRLRHRGTRSEDLTDESETRATGAEAEQASEEVVRGGPLVADGRDVEHSRGGAVPVAVPHRRGSVKFPLGWEVSEDDEERDTVAAVLAELQTMREMREQQQEQQQQEQQEEQRPSEAYV